MMMIYLVDYHGNLHSTICTNAYTYLIVKNVYFDLTFTVPPKYVHSQIAK